MMKELMTTLAVLGVTGCAAVQIPADQLERSEASIRGAEEVGAQDVPEARLHLQMAKDENAAAKQMAAKGDKRAVLMLARADSDSELALGLARQATVHADVVKAAEELRAVNARSTP